jgi:predicted NUDIX family phosphoesterase
MTDERVLCVPSDYVDAVLRLDESDADKLAMLLDHNVYRNRKTPSDDGPCAEEDERWVQLIPYVVTRCGGLILAYQRAGTETRLDGLWSIGIGGHINHKDKGWLDGVHRELREELGFTAAIVPPETLFGVGDWAVLSGPLGFLRSDLTAVDRVHLGVLYTLDVPDVNAVHMTECADYVWEAASCLDVRNLENWSRMAIGMLKGGA